MCGMAKQLPSPFLPPHVVDRRKCPPGRRRCGVPGHLGFRRSGIRPISSTTARPTVQTDAVELPAIERNALVGIPNDGTKLLALNITKLVRGQDVERRPIGPSTSVLPGRASDVGGPQAIPSGQLRASSSMRLSRTRHASPYAYGRHGGDASPPPNRIGRPQAVAIERAGSRMLRLFTRAPGTDQTSRSTTAGPRGPPDWDPGSAVGRRVVVVSYCLIVLPALILSGTSSS